MALKDTIPQMDGAYDDISESEDEDTTDDSIDSSTQINSANDINCARLLITNARSLLPKIDALTHAFDSLDLHIAGITETWMKNGSALKGRLEDLEDDKGIRLIHKCRGGRGGRHGGGSSDSLQQGNVQPEKTDVSIHET